MPRMTGSCQIGQQAQRDEPTHYAYAPCARAERFYTVGKACKGMYRDDRGTRERAEREGRESICGLARM